MKGMLQKMGLKEGERIESGLVSRSIGKAQKNVENHNFDMRKSLVEYDQVRNEQRRVIYTLRQRILEGEDMRSTVMEMVERRVADSVSRFLPRSGEPNVAGLGEWYRSRFDADAALEGADRKDAEPLITDLAQQADRLYADRELAFGLSEMRRSIGALARRFMPEHGELVKNFAEFARQIKDRFGVTVPEALVRLPQEGLVDSIADLVVREKQDEVNKSGAARLRALERFVLLNKIDEKWKEMLHNMDQLRDIVGMRSFAQQDPKLEYKRDATELFQSMMEAIDEDVTTLVFRMRDAPEGETRMANRWQAAEFRKDEVGQFDMSEGGSSNGEEKAIPFRAEKKPGRNEPCWCGNGKKYKKCHWPK
jgi:preprotein translocase subunit SecA